MKSKIGLSIVFVVLLVLLVGCSSTGVSSDDAVIGTINRLVSIAQEAAPQAWAMARQRVAALVVMDFAIAAVMLALDVGIYAIWRKTVKSRRDKKDKWGDLPGMQNEEYYEWNVLFVLVAALPTLIVLGNIYENIGRLISPDYYALRVIMELIPK